MTVTVSFDTPQIQVNNSSTGIQLAQVILPYSIRNSEDFSQYLGGQMTLGQSDGIKLTDNTKDWERLGLAKIKNMALMSRLWTGFFDTARCRYPEKFSKPRFQPTMA